MSLRINHNISALNGHRNLLANNKAIGKSLEKLSSGLRINRAADDAAGLVISEQMRAQISGLNQAIENSEAGVAMIQTAEGALDEINSLLNKARELTLHAANEGSNDTNQLVADQAELDNVVASISRIAEFAQFGTKKLLDGSMNGATNLSSGLSRVNVGNLANNTAINTGTVSMTVNAGSQEANALRGATVADDGYIFSTGGTNSGIALGSETVNSGVTVTLQVDEDVVSYTTTGAQTSSEVRDSLNNLVSGYTISLGTSSEFVITRDGVGDEDFSSTLTFSKGAQAAQAEIAENITASVQLISSGLGNSSNASAVIFTGSTALSGLTASSLVTSGVVFNAQVTTATGGTANVNATAAASGDTIASMLSQLEDAISGAISTFSSGSLSFAGGTSSGFDVRLARADGSIDTDFNFSLSIDYTNPSSGQNRIEAIDLTDFNFIDTGDVSLAQSTFTSSGVTGSIATGSDLTNDSRLQAGQTMSVTVNGQTVSYTATGGGTTISALVAGINAQLSGFTFGFVTGGADLDTLGGNFADGSGTAATPTSGAFAIASNSPTTDDFTLSISFDQAVSGDVTSSTTVGVNNGVSAGMTFNLGTTTQTREDSQEALSAHLASNISNLSSSTVNTAGSDVTATMTSANGVQLTLEQSFVSESGATTLELDDASITLGYKDVSIELSTGLAVDGGVAHFDLDNGALFQIGANEQQNIGITIQSVDATELGRYVEGAGPLLSLADLVSTSKSALTTGLTAEALRIIDKTIDQITTLRGSLGAFQSNTLESGLNNLRVSNENLTFSESTIRDVDFAAESAEFTRQNILVQSATSMLAQANQLPQNVLQLLQ